jgi:hypothetical protein
LYIIKQVTGGAIATPHALLEASNRDIARKLFLIRGDFMAVRCHKRTAQAKTPMKFCLQNADTSPYSVPHKIPHSKAA